MLVGKEGGTVRGGGGKHGHITHPISAAPAERASHVHPWRGTLRREASSRASRASAAASALADLAEEGAGGNNGAAGGIVAVLVEEEGCNNGGIPRDAENARARTRRSNIVGTRARVC